MPPTVLLVDDNPELLALFTQLLEEEGYRVKAFGRARPALEAAQAERPAAAVLDLLLPDVPGLKVAEELRLMHPGLPLVLMTGVFKGGTLAQDAKQKTQAAYYFEKPFDARELLRALHTLVPSPGKGQVAEGFDAELFEQVEGDALPPQELEAGESLRGALQFVPQVTPAPAPAAARRPASRRPSRSGDLEDNLPSLIHAFFQTKETGELGVQRGKVRKVIYFQAGLPVWARSNLQAEKFATFLVRMGRLAAGQVDALVEESRATGVRVGDLLVNKGLLSNLERFNLLGTQVKSIIYSTFAWEDGTFQLAFTDQPGPEAVQLDVHPGNLIIRGIKKLYAPERVARLTPLGERLIPSQQASFQLYELELEPWEASFLTRVDGLKTTGELLGLAGVPEHQARAFLVAMVALNVLERR